MAENKKQPHTFKEWHGTSLCTKDVLGGKGFYSVAMTGMGLPVPEGLIVPVSVGKLWATNKKAALELINEAVRSSSDVFGEEEDAPLVSVRSGAPVSMPGMMDTVLNVGLTEHNLDLWKTKLGERVALDCYRRLREAWAKTVKGIPDGPWKKARENVCAKFKVSEASELNVNGLEALLVEYSSLEKKFDAKLPGSRNEQIVESMKAVFDSWMSERAIAYRKAEGLSNDMGTACIIQRMVLGNSSPTSCSGVYFTRNPSTGRRSPYGEFRANVQGEDVVSGAVTPHSFDEMRSWEGSIGKMIWSELVSRGEEMEAHFGDMMDIEFTVDNGVLWFLQCRPGKREPQAAIKIAVDLFEEKRADIDRVFSLVTWNDIVASTRPRIDPSFSRMPDAEGLSASTGVCFGEAVFTSEDALSHPRACILITEETEADDIPGMQAAEGVVTAKGGVTSHAAVVARAMGKVCVVGSKDIKVERDDGGDVKAVFFRGNKIKKGDPVAVDGGSGRIWLGTDVPIIDGSSSPELSKLVEFAVKKTGCLKCVSDPYDIDIDVPSLWLTSGLDGYEAPDLRHEIKETLPFMNGIVSLCTAEEDSPDWDAPLTKLIGLDFGNDAFRVKAETILASTNDLSKVSFYLGARESEWITSFENAGLRVVKQRSLEIVQSPQQLEEALKKGKTVAADARILLAATVKGGMDAFASVASDEKPRKSKRKP